MIARLLDLRVRCRAFDAAVPAKIIVRSVAVSFSVGLVVLAIEGNQIIQCEAIMAGDEIDALLGFALFALVYVRAPRQSEGHRTSCSVAAFEKRPDIVAKPPVPFFPAVADERADLIKAGGVPGLGDQLDIGEDGVGFDIPKDRRRRHRPAFLVTRQYRGEIDAKAVDTHLADPITETVENQTTDNRLIGVQGIAAAGVICKRRSKNPSLKRPGCPVAPE